MNLTWQGWQLRPLGAIIAAAVSELSVGEHYWLILSYCLACEYGIDDLISDYISHL